jgi:uncharacterized phage-associated protein
MNTVHQVAKHVIGQLGETTAMKLQKLVYYCQAWSLAWDDEPLFDEDFEAWANGPVCPELFRKHKGRYKVDSGLFEDTAEGVFNAANTETMGAVIRDYGDKEPYWLSEATHMEAPWKDARRGLAPGENGSNVITKESMQLYYGSLIND